MITNLVYEDFPSHIGDRAKMDFVTKYSKFCCQGYVTPTEDCRIAGLNSWSPKLQSHSSFTFGFTRLETAARSLFFVMRKLSWRLKILNPHMMWVDVLIGLGSILLAIFIILGIVIIVVSFTHCLMGVSTRPAWHSKFYAWLFLLWPRLIQNSCWINLKGGAFWENLSSVVTSLDSRKTNWEIIKRTFLLAIKGITVNIVTTTEILIPVQAFLKAFIASYSLFLGDILPFL